MNPHHAIPFHNLCAEQSPAGGAQGPHDAGGHVRHFVRPQGSPPVNGYSHAVAFTGQLVAVSGQVPVDADGGLVGESDATAQLRQVFANLGTALRAAGARFQDVVKLTVFLTDMADLPAFRQVRDEHLDPTRLPACSLVQVAGLVHPAFRVEIDALAVLSDSVGRPMRACAPARLGAWAPGRLRS